MAARQPKENTCSYAIRDLDKNLYKKMQETARSKGMTTKTWLLLLIQRELDHDAQGK